MNKVIILFLILLFTNFVNAELLKTLDLNKYIEVNNEESVVSGEFYLKFEKENGKFQLEVKKDSKQSYYTVQYYLNEGSCSRIWITINGQKYLSNRISVLKVNNNEYCFLEADTCESVLSTHIGSLFEIQNSIVMNLLKLNLIDQKSIKSWEEDDAELFNCIKDKINTQGIKLLVWDDKKGLLKINFDICEK